ncbi:MAG: response regulator transcription factor [Pseudomonadota bacterium]|nr:response regulator transcription factor [Pseudomonadota bacterium]
MRIALVEDDPIQAQLLINWLTVTGHHLHHYSNGESFIRALNLESFDLIIMDWGLPDISGIELLKSARAKDTLVPVLFITSRDSEQDIIAALSAGADDYLVKPPRQGETLARITALQRRSQAGGGEDKLLQFGPYTFDCERNTVSHDDEVIQFTHKEFEFARFLFQNCNRLLSRGHLLENVWGLNADITTRTVDVHASKVRRKLGLSAVNGWRLVSIYQYGYRLEAL